MHILCKLPVETSLIKDVIHIRTHTISSYLNHIRQKVLDVYGNEPLIQATYKVKKFGDIKFNFYLSPEIDSCAIFNKKYVSNIYKRQL